MDRGVPKEDIFMDHAGFDTYDSMYRARDAFDDVTSLIITTQAFHLPRALCRPCAGHGCCWRRRNRPTLSHLLLHSPDISRTAGAHQSSARRGARQAAAVPGPVIPISGDGTQTEG